MTLVVVVVVVIMIFSLIDIVTEQENCLSWRQDVGYAGS
jgi:hypothetical protein